MLACDAGAGGSAYHLTDHACRHCAGRVLQSGDTFRCGGCGAVCMERPAGICGCGVVKAYKNGQATFRCATNPARSAAMPSEIVIVFDDPARAA